MAVGRPLLVIIGATASGKSDLALRVAERAGGGATAGGGAAAAVELLSVDSMQVYRHMNIGTAKPTPAERARVPHHLIDVVEPNESFTVARFVELADATIAGAAARGAGSVPLIATGGTPLYYKALFEGLFEGPPASDTIRARLRSEPNEALHRRLAEVDPAAAVRIHVNDTKRLLRALEVFEMTGQPISSLQTEWADPKARHRAIWFGLDWEKDALNRRINARVKAMIAAGWLEETRSLLERFGELSQTAGEATGYRELIAHVRGRMSLDEAVEQIKIGTRQLARRQIKWFRRFPDVTWLRGDADPEANAGAVLERWANV
ncbi:MAG TPA: tRNA (adenosine(37)-N6)-dimethylallyltransferase MiaA [Tepidisphaeraceae bacterium]|nr:tRNA (adenosine(37)-N6)-dimethylallyltransferase MiaA [Tepidisphaeraceae bacterium]